MEPMADTPSWKVLLVEDDYEDFLIIQNRLSNIKQKKVQLTHQFAGLQGQPFLQNLDPLPGHQRVTESETSVEVGRGDHSFAAPGGHSSGQDVWSCC